ncbi:MAG: DUF6259 domain-containing protein [Armatimonadota bacterium]
MRLYIGLLITLGVSYVCIPALGAVDEGSKEMVIENEFYRVIIDSEKGVIRGIQDRIGHVEFTDSDGLADNYKLVLEALPDQTNDVLGKEQPLTSLEQKSDGASLYWKGPLKNTIGQPIDVDVTMNIRFVGESMRFTLDVTNRTSVKIARAIYPMLAGEFIGSGELKDPRAANTEWRINHTDPYLNKLPNKPLPTTYIGNYPIWMGMPWFDISNPNLNRGMYFASYDIIGRAKSAYLDLLPTKTVLKDLLYWAHHPYLKPGGSWSGPEVVAQFHPGNWKQAARIYREWFVSQYGIADPRKSWLRNTLAYQDVMLLLPEGNVNMTFKEIPKWAEDGLKIGVKAILVSGWNLYGHDGGYPYYDPDPRLGTWEDLEEAIRKCHKMGVKVFFFVNIQPVDINTDWFRDELYKYESNLASGRCGFGMGTLSARKGWAVQTMAMLSPGFPEYRKIMVDKMKRLTEAGADGLHIDKFFPPGLDMNPNLKVDPDMADTEYAMVCVKEIADTCRAINPNLTLSFETYWDRALEYSAGVTWHWGAGYDNFQMIKFVFPEWINSLAMNQPYDYTVVNQCVRYGYHLMIGPKNWTASIGDELYKPLGAYIKEVLPIWEELKETIFFGEFLDNDGVEYEGTTETRCSVHRNLKTGKKATIVVNFSTEPREVSIDSFGDNKNGTVRIYQPYAKVKTAKLPLIFSVLGERFVAVVED